MAALAMAIPTSGIARVPNPTSYSAEPESGVNDSELATDLGTLEQELRLGEIPSDFWERPRELWLHRKATKETVKTVYWKDGAINQEGYWQLCSILRDTHQNKMTYMDPVLFDILRGVLGYYQAWKWPYPLVITSGYRTVKTNNSLISEGAVKNSQHLYGKAVDSYMPGASIKDLFNLAKYFQLGGVGFYPSKLFVHIDRGRVRQWTGK